MISTNNSLPGLLNFVLTILGLGMLAEQIIRHLSRDRSDAVAG